MLPAKSAAVSSSWKLALLCNSSVKREAGLLSIIPVRTSVQQPSLFPCIMHPAVLDVWMGPKSFQTKGNIKKPKAVSSPHRRYWGEIHQASDDLSEDWTFFKLLTLLEIHRIRILAFMFFYWQTLNCCKVRLNMFAFNGLNKAAHGS